MSIAPKDSQIKLTPAQEAEVMKLNSVQEINQFMRDAALAQSLVRPLDAAHPDILVDVLQPTRKTATIALDGQTYEFSADSDEELTRVQLDFMRGRKNDAAAPAAKTVVVNGRSFSGSQDEIDTQLRAYFQSHPKSLAANTAEPKTEPARDTAGKFTAQKDPALAAADKAMLELKWKRGEIDTAEYLAQSGALDEYATKVQERVGQAEIQLWAQATTQFLKTSDWPGGEDNRERLGNALEELHLTDATDKVAALHQAYDAMKRGDAYTAMTKELAEANSQADIAAIRAKYAQKLGVSTNAGGVNGGGGYFGGS